MTDAFCSSSPVVGTAMTGPLPRGRNGVRSLLARAALQRVGRGGQRPPARSPPTLSDLELKVAEGDLRVRDATVQGDNCRLCRSAGRARP